MFRNTAQRMVTVFFSCGSKPLANWETHVKNGYIQKILDPEIKSTVFELGGLNVSTTYMVCPKGKTVLGITKPFLVMIVKNLKKYFSFEVTILDETGMRRRFRASNFQSTTTIQPFCTAMPIGLSGGWNQIQFNLAEFTKRAYQKQFKAVQKVQINANIYLRRIYFTERLLPEDQLPPEYKIFFPLASKVKSKKFGEPKTEDVLVTEERKSSKEVFKTESRRSVHSQTTSQHKVEEIETNKPIAAPEEIAPTEALEETLPEDEQNTFKERGEELPEGEQIDITEVLDEATTMEGDAVLPVERQEVPPVEETEPQLTGRNVGDSFEPLEPRTSRLDSELTPITEGNKDMIPEIIPGTEAPPTTTESSTEMEPQTELPSEIEILLV